MVLTDRVAETNSRSLNNFGSKRRATLDGETTVYLSYTINENGVR